MPSPLRMAFIGGDGPKQSPAARHPGYAHFCGRPALGGGRLVGTVGSLMKDALPLGVLDKGAKAPRLLPLPEVSPSTEVGARLAPDGKALLLAFGKESALEVLDLDDPKARPRLLWKAPRPYAAAWLPEGRVAAYAKEALHLLRPAGDGLELEATTKQDLCHELWPVLGGRALVCRVFGSGNKSAWVAYGVGPGKLRKLGPKLTAYDRVLFEQGGRVFIGDEGRFAYELLGLDEALAAKA